MGTHSSTLPHTPPHRETLGPHRDPIGPHRAPQRPIGAHRNPQSPEEPYEDHTGSNKDQWGPTASPCPTPRPIAPPCPTPRPIAPPPHAPCTHPDVREGHEFSWPSCNARVGHARPVPCTPMPRARLTSASCKALWTHSAPPPTHTFARPLCTLTLSAGGAAVGAHGAVAAEAVPLLQADAAVSTRVLCTRRAGAWGG